MGKIASDATLLKREKMRSRRLEVQLGSAREARDEYMDRAQKAEQEASEWRRRFDLLLSRTPSLPLLANDQERLQKCVDLLRQNPEENYVAAVKLHRELFGSDLKTAVDVIRPERDKLRAQVNGTGGT